MIRAFHDGDLPTLMRIWLEGNLQAHPFIPAAYWQAHEEAVRALLPQAELYLFEDAGEIRGFAGLQGDFLAGIFVSAHTRSQGIGHALLAHAKSLHSSLTLQVYRRNERAARFYLREGFTPLREEIDDETGELAYTMRWTHDT